MYLFVVTLLAVLPLVAAGVFLRSVKKSHSKYKNPLTKSLRRPPGAELGRKLGAEQMEVGFNVAEVILPGLIPLFTYISIYRLEFISSQVIVMILSVVAAMAMWIMGVKKLRKRLETIRTLRLGYECELAVGQELDLLMLYGYRVFHDLPAEAFNIDHVVVGPAGVFAVETKGRSKRAPDDREKKADYKVSYSSGRLDFPFYSDTKTIPQAVRQAQWLSHWLSSATAIPIEVSPLVVLPGWFVEVKDKPAVPVIASGYIDGYFRRGSRKNLDAEQISRIVHQLDARVRDLKPGELVRPKAVEG